MSQNTQSTIEQPSSFSYSSATGEMLTSPSLYLLGGLLAFVAYQQLTGKGSNTNPQLAFGRWAGKPEQKTAFERALRQIQHYKFPSTALILERVGEIHEHYPTALPDVNRGVAIMGGPGSGKTFSSFLPAIFSAADQGHPMIIYDFKYPDLTSQVAGHIAKRDYNIRVFAPGYEESDTVNILDFLDPDDPSLMAGQFAATLRQNYKQEGAKDSDAFFSESGDSLIQSVLMLAKESSYPDIVMCQAILGLSELGHRIEEIYNQGQMPHSKFGKMSYLTYLTFSTFRQSKKSEKTVAGIVATALNMFTKFMKPKLLRNLTGTTTLPLELGHKDCLIIGMETETRDIVAPLVASVLDLILSKNFKNQRLHPLLVFLDEFPTLKLSRIVRDLNERRSYGYCGFLGFQNLGQIDKTYGKEIRNAILGACATKMIYNPQEPESAEYFSRILGKEEIMIDQISTSSSKQGSSTSTTKQRQLRDLMSAQDIQQFPEGMRIVLNPGYRGKGILGFQKAYVPHLECPNLADNEQFQATLSQSAELWLQILERLKKRAKTAGKDAVVTDEQMELRSKIAAEMLKYSKDEENSSSSSSPKNQSTQRVQPDSRWPQWNNIKEAVFKS